MFFASKCHAFHGCDCANPFSLLGKLQGVPPCAHGSAGGLTGPSWSLVAPLCPTSQTSTRLRPKLGWQMRDPLSSRRIEPVLPWRQHLPSFTATMPGCDLPAVGVQSLGLRSQCCVHWLSLSFPCWPPASLYLPDPPLTSALNIPSSPRHATQTPSSGHLHRDHGFCPLSHQCQPRAGGA